MRRGQSHCDSSLASSACNKRFFSATQVFPWVVPSQADFFFLTTLRVWPFCSECNVVMSGGNWQAMPSPSKRLEANLAQSAPLFDFATGRGGDVCTTQYLHKAILESIANDICDALCMRATHTSSGVASHLPNGSFSPAQTTANRQHPQRRTKERRRWLPPPPLHL